MLGILLAVALILLKWTEIISLDWAIVLLTAALMVLGGVLLMGRKKNGSS